jgi:hypothetical protein
MEPNLPRHTFAMTRSERQRPIARFAIAVAIVALLLAIGVGVLWRAQVAASRERLANRIGNAAEAIESLKAQQHWSRYLRRRYNEAAAYLEHATAESLSSPTCIVAFARQREIRGGPRWIVSVLWLSNDPLASGMRVQTPDRTHNLVFRFPSGLILTNIFEAAELVLFSATLNDQDGAGPWDQLSPMLGAPLEVVLLNDNGEDLTAPQELVVVEY